MSEFMSHQTTFTKPEVRMLLFHRSAEAPQISKHLFTAKLPYIQRDYTELHIFRQQIEQTREGFHPQPYTENKPATLFYRSIFFGFALLFAILATCIIFGTATMNYTFFNFSLVFKGVLTLTCGTLATSALLLALRMRTEREAVLHYYHKAKTHAYKIYARKKMKMGIKRFLLFFDRNQRQSAALAHLYHDACDKIHACKEETLRLVTRIRSSRKVDAKTKEMLYNQAIAEFNDKLTLIAHTFKTATLPHFGN